jgi:hypothetical protein
VLLREMEPIFSTVRDQYFTELIWLILKWDSLEWLLQLRFHSS